MSDRVYEFGGEPPGPGGSFGTKDMTPEVRDFIGTVVRAREGEWVNTDYGDPIHAATVTQSVKWRRGKEGWEVKQRGTRVWARR